MLTMPSDLLARTEDLLSSGDRKILGIAGPPGAGKSTLAHWLEAKLIERYGTSPLLVALMPMDGFRLSNAELARRGLTNRKGAPETFDVAAYSSLLDDIRQNQTEVFAPAYSRTIHEPVANAHRIPSTVRLVITEGNYLLLGIDGWQAIREKLDESWFLQVPPNIARQRLIERRLAGYESLSFEQAQEWVDRSDTQNAELIRASSGPADFLVDIDDLLGPT